MASTTASQRGRRAAATCLLIGVVGVGFPVVGSLTHLNVTISSWLVISIYIVMGLVGLIAGVITIFNGRRWTRLAGVLGFLLNLVVEAIGLALLYLSLHPSTFFFE